MLTQYINEIKRNDRSQLMAIATYGNDAFISEIVNYAIAQSKLRPSTGYAESINAAVTQMARDAMQQDEWHGEQYDDDQLTWQGFELGIDSISISEELQS